MKKSTKPVQAQPKPIEKDSCWTSLHGAFQHLFSAATWEPPNKHTWLPTWIKQCSKQHPFGSPLFTPTKCLNDIHIQKNCLLHPTEKPLTSSYYGEHKEHSFQHMQKNILFNNGVLSFEENYIPFFLPKNNNVQKICGVPPCPSLLEKHPIDILPKSIMPNTSKRLLALTKILHPQKKKKRF